MPDDGALHAVTEWRCGAPQSNHHWDGQVFAESQVTPGVALE
jgi:hypothetical protein